MFILRKSPCSVFPQHLAPSSDPWLTLMWVSGQGGESPQSVTCLLSIPQNAHPSAVPGNLTDLLRVVWASSLQGFFEVVWEGLGELP